MVSSLLLFSFQAVNELLATSLKDFEHAYGQWCEAYGEKHLQTVKAITMIGQLQSRINGKEAGIEWSRRELRIREELQGELHPRTQQARRNYTNMIDDKLRNRALDSTAISEAMKASQVRAGGASNPRKLIFGTGCQGRRLYCGCREILDRCWRI